VGKNRTGLNALHRDHPDENTGAVGQHEDTGAVGQHIALERLIEILYKGRLTKAEHEHLSLCVLCPVLLHQLREIASDSGESGLTGPEGLASHPDHLGGEVGAAGQHVELERLIDFLDKGRLTEAERKEVKEHLYLCVRCSVLLRELHEFAADSGERGLSGPESLEQDAWELLVQSRPVATTERPMPRFPFVQHFFSEASAGLLHAVFHPFATRQRVEPLSPVEDTAHHPYMVVLRRGEASPESVFLYGEGKVVKDEEVNPEGTLPLLGRIAAGRSVRVPPAATLRDGETCPETIFLQEGTVNSVRIPVQEGGFTVTVSLAKYPPYRKYRFELRDRNGKVLCSCHQRSESLSGDAETSVYVAAPPGFYRFRIEGHDANRRKLLVEYLLEVEPVEANDGTAGPKGP
jgi:hypothetical protein